MKLTMKKVCVWTCAVLALALVLPLGCSAYAQAAASSGDRVSQGVSSADYAILQAHKAELVKAARIYGYDLAARNWRFEQARCAAMPETLLLRYHREFAGGAESVFVAAVPRAEGRVRIVPVLYRNATPFVPAATNPRNVTLFNQLVPRPVARHDASAAGNWVELSACYAALTGGRVKLSSGSKPEVGIAGAPAPTIRLEPEGRVLRTTLATRENASAYKIWNLSFNRSGRVTNVATDDEPVHAVSAAPPLHAVKTTGGKRAASRVAGRPAPATAGVAASVSPSEVVTTEPGWKFIPRAPDPPSKIIPPAPQPKEITMPQP